MELQTLHERLFGILEFLDSTCKKLGLTYYLGYGTLLGAVRHKEFIPWDDDADVWMKREDLTKLLKYLRTENTDERYVLNEGEFKDTIDYPPEFQTRILDSKTTIKRPLSGRIIEYHLWLDIFTLDSYPHEKERSYTKNFKRKLFRYKISRCKRFLFNDGSFLTKINRIIYKMHNKFGFFKRTFVEEKEIDRTYKALIKYKDDPRCDKYFTYSSVYLNTLSKCVFKSEWFAETVELDFMDKKFLAPKCYHEILSSVYGNYMELPDESKRINHAIKSMEISE